MNAGLCSVFAVSMPHNAFSLHTHCEHRAGKALHSIFFKRLEPGRNRHTVPGMMMKRRKKWAEDVHVENPGRITKGVLRFARWVVAPIVKILYRPTLEGIENLPEQGPFLLVGNHSAGMGIAEVLSFAVKYIEQTGNERPLAGFAIPVVFHVYPLSAVVRCLGAIPSTYKAARKTLAMGVPILVFPGGDHESLRPVHQAGRVDFGGRLGFLRIARAAKVPVVPMGIRGSHLTAPVLFRSRILAYLFVLPRFFGIKRWAITVLGLFVAGIIAAFLPLPWPARAFLAWFWLGTPFVFLPWIPWKIRMRIGKPLSAEDLFNSSGKPSDAISGDNNGVRGEAGRDGEGNENDLRHALHIVESAVQASVDKGGCSRF